MLIRPMPRVLFLLLLLNIAACGGGGSSDPASPAGVSPIPNPPPEPTVSQLQDASRLASFATFGLPFEAIDQIARTGLETWLEDQFALPVTTQRAIVDDLITRREAGEFTTFETDIELLIAFRRYAWWHRAMTAPDVVRQRFALALSEIMVVSDNVDALIINPYAMSDYYDTLLENAFGNYRDLLRSVALHPSMGIYLSHINNARSNPITNTFPDENFAREVMQLFSIGLFELNDDGSFKLDSTGQPIATYSNTQIREFAKVFTGFSYGGPGAFFGNPEPRFQFPMVMFDEAHESGVKNLLNGVTLPTGQSGMQDFEGAIDNLFNHPNVGPFIGKQLIQRLVTSNPSPAYVSRVADAFNGSSTGVRGDMKTVLRAILRDPEIANSSNPTEFGKLREPMLRHLAMARQFKAESTDGFYFNDGFFLQRFIRQHPLSSPSVFNFFLPAHSPAGSLAAAGLVAPEFQITNANTIINMTNLVDFAVNGNFVMSTAGPFGEVTLNLSDYVALAGDIDTLLNRLDLVLTYGRLSDETRAAMTRVLQQISGNNALRAQTAVYLFLISPDYAVQN